MGQNKGGEPGAMGHESTERDKPSWDDAPEWAMSLGVADWDCDYKGQWCWICDPNPSYFSHVEQRPLDSFPKQGL